MKRNQRIGIRVSKEELAGFEKCADECNMSLDDWARNRLGENCSYSEKSRKLVSIVASMQTSINKIRNDFDVDIRCNAE